VTAPFASKRVDEVERTFRADGTIEAAVWDVVVAANALGIPTRASCEGHSRNDAPYVAFGLDYGDCQPDELPELQLANEQAKRRLRQLVDAFYGQRPRPRGCGLFVSDGPDAEAMRRLRARFARQRRALERSDPDRVARSFNYRQFEDTFLLRADGGSWSTRTLLTRQLLSRRQAEMRAFGRFVRREAICGSRSCSPSSGTSRSAAP